MDKNRVKIGLLSSSQKCLKDGKCLAVVVSLICAFNFDCHPLGSRIVDPRTWPDRHHY